MVSKRKTIGRGKVRVPNLQEKIYMIIAKLDLSSLSHLGEKVDITCGTLSNLSKSQGPVFKDHLKKLCENSGVCTIEDLIRCDLSEFRKTIGLK